MSTESDVSDGESGGGGADSWSVEDDGDVVSE